MTTKTTKTTITMIDNHSTQDIINAMQCNEDGNDDSADDDNVNDHNNNDMQPAQGVLLLREVSEVEELARRVALVRKSLMFISMMRMFVIMMIN